MPYVGVGWAYVDNPFYDPLDATALDLATTGGHSAQFDVDGGLALTLPLGAQRGDAALFGRYSVWSGAARAAGWDLGLRLGWSYELSDGVEGGLQLHAIASAIDTFPEDDVRYGEARLTLRWARPVVGIHRLQARIGVGLRHRPDRIGDRGRGEIGRSDQLLRARVGLRTTRWAGIAFEPAYTLDLTRPRGDARPIDTHAMTLRASRPLGPVGGSVTVSGWLRAFDDVPARSARADRGAMLGARLSRVIWPGLEVAGRYRYLRSTSDAATGRYVQHFAGLEAFVWWPDAPSKAPSTAHGARPLPTTAGWIFRHRAQRAKSIALVGDFNDWSPARHPLTGPDRDGWWSVVLPLEPGRYTYMFVVDGDRFERPADAPRYADDGFGGEVGVLYVVPTDEAAGR